MLLNVSPQIFRFFSFFLSSFFNHCQHTRAPVQQPWILFPACRARAGLAQQLDEEDTATCGSLCCCKVLDALPCQKWTQCWWPQCVPYFGHWCAQFPEPITEAVPSCFLSAGFLEHRKLWALKILFIFIFPIFLNLVLQELVLCHVCVLTGAVFLHICQLLSSFLFQGWPLERNRSQFTPHTVLNNLGKSKHYFASWVFCQVSLLPVTPRFCYSWFLSFPQGRAFQNSAGLWCFWELIFLGKHTRYDGYVGLSELAGITGKHS